MNRTPMIATEIAALMAAYEQVLAEKDWDEDGGPAGAMVETAAREHLSLVEWHDQSGGLYRNRAGRYCFGWETTGGFDDQIGEDE